MVDVLYDYKRELIAEENDEHTPTKKTKKSVAPTKEIVTTKIFSKVFKHLTEVMLETSHLTLLNEEEEYKFLNESKEQQHSCDDQNTKYFISEDKLRIYNNKSKDVVGKFDTDGNFKYIYKFLTGIITSFSSFITRLEVNSKLRYMAELALYTVMGTAIPEVEMTRCNIFKYVKILHNMKEGDCNVYGDFKRNAWYSVTVDDLTQEDGTIDADTNISHLSLVLLYAMTERLKSDGYELKENSYYIVDNFRNKNLNLYLEKYGKVLEKMALIVNNQEITPEMQDLFERECVTTT